MSIADYGELQTAVGRWMQRSDLASLIPDFVANAEAEFNRTLRLNGQMTRDNLIVSGRFTTLTFTAPIAEIRSVSCTNGGVRWALEYATPDQLQNSYDTGEPTYYSRHGTELECIPVPSTSYTLEVLYWRTIPALSSVSTNFLLTLAPDLYLYRSVLEGARYTFDDALAARVEPMYLRALAQVQSDDTRRQFGGSGLQMRAA